MVGKAFDEWEAEQPQTPLDWLRERPELYQQVIRLGEAGKSGRRVFVWLVKEHGYPDSAPARVSVDNLVQRHKKRA